MRIRCLIFAGLSESLGEHAIHLTLPDPATVRDALAALQSHFSESLNTKNPPLDLSPDSRQSIAFAVNHAYVREDAPLHDGDELALIPPVSGG